MVTRAEALRFLAHFVADLHQPLHCTERNGDKGGNLVKVTFLSEPEVTNLHRVWDSMDRVVFAGGGAIRGSHRVTVHALLSQLGRPISATIFCAGAPPGA